MKLKIILCLFLIHNFTTANTQVKSRIFTISGVVLDTITNKPLLGVYISVGNKGGQTNIKGEYTIESVPAGEIRIGTMYYNSYSQQFKKINLQKDTIINFHITNELVMDEIVVTGTRTEKRLSDTPILTTVINERSIRTAASTTALESLLDNVPGILGSQNSMGANIRIKGLNSRYVLFLVDGERMVAEGASGNINLNQIDLNNIKKIEMINGAASALYGSNAVGAVINFITKEPTHKFEAGVNIVGETNNTLRTSANVGMNIKKVKLNTGVFRHSSNGFDIKDGHYAARYSDYGGNIKLIYNPMDRVDITLSGRYFSHETFNPENSLNASHMFTQNINLGINSGLKSKDERNNLRVSFNYNKYLGFNVLEKKNNKKVKKDEASYISTRILNSFSPSEKWEIVAGLEHNNERNFSISTLGEGSNAKMIDDANLFAQAEYEVVKNFDIVAGARYTYNSQFKSAFSPKLSLMYELHDFKFRGGVGTAFRAPSLKELYYDFDHQGMFWIYGNPNLDAEKGIFSSLSTEYSKRYFNASISAYYNDINKKITQYELVKDKRTEMHYKNISSATIKGFDLTLSQIFIKQLTTKINYSYCDAKDNATGLQLPSNVKHSVTISTTWNGTVARSPFSLHISGILNSPRLYSEVVINDTGEEFVELSESKSHSIWKIAIVKPIRINKHTIEVTGKVDNLFGFKADTYVNSGRQFLIGVRYSFK